MTLLELAYAILLFAALIVVPGGVTLLKGQRALFGAGFAVGGLVWMLSAFRLAKPESWWARRFYDGDKLARARRRYES